MVQRRRRFRLDRNHPGLPAYQAQIPPISPPTADRDQERVDLRQVGF
jgi:hypothetical protein